MVQIVHRKIKINDDAALENFSQIFLPARQRSFEFKRSVIKSGVRVIKPDGTVKPVKSSEYIKNEDDDTKKLAIPGLEKGDILEYFIYVVDDHNSQYMNSSAAEGLNPILFDHFSVQSEYPILNFKYHIQTDKKFRTHMLSNSNTLEVNSSFRDPDLKVYAVTGAQIPYQESQIWTSRYNDLDYIKAMVKLDPKAPNKIAGPLEKDRILRNINVLAENARIYYSATKQTHNKYLKKTAQKSLKKSEELEDFYYYCRHVFMERGLLNSKLQNYPASTVNGDFIMYLLPKLQELELDYSILAVLPRNDGKIDHVYTNLEFTYVIKVNLGREPLYFTYLTPFATYGEIPAYLEDSFAYEAKFYNGNTKSSNVSKAKTPTSLNKENMVTHNATIKLDLNSDNMVNIVNDIQTKGHQMSSLILPLTDWYDGVIAGDRKYLLKGTGKMVSLAEMSSKRQAVYKTIQKEKKTSIKEQTETYAKSQYTKDITNISDLKSSFVEDRKNPPYMDVHFKCNYNDILKKVGPNYIFKVGKLVGGQVDIDDEPRRYDIHMDHPRSFQYNFKIEIPEGYEAVGLEDMDKDITNAAGDFKLSHTIEGNILDLTFMKVYRNYFQFQSEWPLMVEFLKPANIFETKEILLKKK